MVGSVCRLAWDERRETGLRTPVDYGTAFDRAPKKLLRQARNRRAARMFEAEEVRQLIDAAGVHLRAMILLACNGGFGNSDCEQLPIEAVDLRAGWIRFPRPKTEVPRAFPLWPETIQALQASFEQRPSPKSEADEGLFFITKYGGPILTAGRGGQPEVERGELIAWHEGLAVRLQELRNQRADRQATAADGYDYGKGGSVALGGIGSAKKRRRDRKP